MLSAVLPPRLLQKTAMLMITKLMKAIPRSTLSMMVNVFPLLVGDVGDMVGMVVLVSLVGLAVPPEDNVNDDPM